MDSYDYALVKQNNKVISVDIEVDSLMDVTIADVTGDITSSNDTIYIEGHYLEMISIDIVSIVKPGDRVQYMMKINVNEI